MRRIWLFSAKKIKSSESGSKQPTQLIVELNSSLRHIIVTIIFLIFTVFPTCHGYDSIFGQGFDDEKYNVEYKPLRSNLSGQEIPVLLNHRVIFGEVQGEGEDEKKRKCLYWEEDLKKWRLGQCLAIGM